VSVYQASLAEAFLSIFITKLDHNTTPEKDNSTDSSNGLTNGIKQAIFCFMTLEVTTISSSHILLSLRLFVSSSPLRTFVPLNPFLYLLIFNL